MADKRVFRNIDEDKEKLFYAERELEWKRLKVHELDCAVEYGRCVKCSKALDSYNTILCEKCFDVVHDI